MYPNINSIPTLSKITYVKKQKPETPEQLRKLLMPKDNLELEEISISDSEVSDAFEDLHLQSFLRRSKDGKTITKLEADRLTMAQFTDNFKETMASIREELNIEKNMNIESIEQIKKIFTEKRDIKNLPDDLQERIDRLLKDEEYLCDTPSQISNDSRKQSSVTFDAMSGIWKILPSRNPDEKCRVSSPSFNAFLQSETQWIERPNVSWQSLDFSKIKCEKWLNEQHD